MESFKLMKVGCEMKKLYHYCSIDTLECILKYKTIRFSSLVAVDDIEEAMTEDFDELGRICFVSCWTNKDEEDVTMWRTYTEDSNGDKSGVRIALPDTIFRNTTLDIVEEIEEKYDIQMSPTVTGSIKREPDLFPVTYTDDETLINMSVFKKHNRDCDNCNKKAIETTIDTAFLGKFKRTVWLGQSEWRFRILGLPKEYYRNHAQGKYLSSDLTLEEQIELMNEDMKNIPFIENYIDFPYNPEILTSLEVLSSPLNTSNDVEIIKLILKESTQVIILKDSTLKIRNRNIN